MNLPNPFFISSQQSLVAIQGQRAGYIQLATSQEITEYSQLSVELFTAAKAWAATLEAHGAKRVYWLTLSEVVPHLHIHLYPRWTDDERKGLPLFEARNESPQPVWPSELKNALAEWVSKHDVYLKS